MSDRYGYLNGLPGAIPKPRGKTKKGIKKASVPEDDIQAEVENYLDSIGVFYIHIPGGVWDYIMEGPEEIKELARDSLKSVPDLMIYAGFGRSLKCLPLELKTEVGRLSPGQQSLQYRIGTIVCRSFEEAKGEIDRFLEENDAS